MWEPPSARFERGAHHGLPQPVVTARLALICESARAREIFHKYRGPAAVDITTGVTSGRSTPGMTTCNPCNPRNPCNGLRLFAVLDGIPPRCNPCNPFWEVYPTHNKSCNGARLQMGGYILKRVTRVTGDKKADLDDKQV